MRHTAFIALVTLAATALLAPAALAERPDDRAGPIGVGSLASAEQPPARPDDRGGTIGVGSIKIPSGGAEVAPRPDDRAGIRLPGPAEVRARVVAVDSDSFDWSDATVGVAAGFGLAIFGGGLVALVLQRRHAHLLA